jgi:ectoine hydroxylase-related dioxygenase (phytanoyl-CoA dioxygenase family)
MQSSVQPVPSSRYGVTEQSDASNTTAAACEQIRRLGYAVVDGGYGTDWLATLSDAFDRAHCTATARHGGPAALTAIDEHNTIRLPLAYEPQFLELATNPAILAICRELIAGYVVLNQQNGIINPPNGARYNQAAWHRDLPYQHFTSSRPLAINALFCLDAFTPDNGSTLVLPASHLQEAFPSDSFAATERKTVTAPAGSFIVLDCMTYHSGGVNTTDRPRRAVNHMYTIPLIRQQIDLPTALGNDFTGDADVRRLLGYEVTTPSSVGAYLASRKRG